LGNNLEVLCRFIMKNLNTVDYTTLFKLSDSFANRPFRLHVESNFIHTPEAVSLFYGEWQPPEPVVFKAYMGGQATDIMWSGFIPLFCISSRVVKVLEENKFTGWSLYPAKVFDHKGNELPDYHGFSVTSYAGKQDLRRSEIITKPPMTTNGEPYNVYKGFYFEDEKWDGSDIFRVYSSHKIVTKKVKEAFKRAKIVNVMFTQLLEDETLELSTQYGKDAFIM
jgi:hypothetical protein